MSEPREEQDHHHEWEPQTGKNQRGAYSWWECVNCDARTSPEFAPRSPAATPPQPSAGLRAAVQRFIDSWDVPAFKPKEREERVTPFVKALRAALADKPDTEPLTDLLTNVEYLMEEHGTRVIDIEDLRAVVRDQRREQLAISPGCPDCEGQGWTAETTADPLPSGEPGEPYQVQRACDTCGGNGRVAAAYTAVNEGSDG